ncbi:phage tail spike protein [Carnobacterium maltaromaticum]|uniref:phage tail spike protein n=1 Tax=Carnobacterium maltaromaticum TaxID=2751 RepID=UPI0012FBF123|nr:phage tail spike protein [Carnobacterium maltaromaticum]
MITLYKKSETIFTHNGLGDITYDVINPEVSWVDNNEYALTFSYLTKSNLAAFIDGQMILKADTPDGPNLFRISKVDKNMGVLNIKAVHISYDLIDNIIEDTFIVDQNGAGAITQLGDKTQYKTNFRFYSNITTIANARIVRMNPIAALIDGSKDNSFLSRWGGHIKRSMLDISMLEKLGADRGVEIRDKKNLIGYGSSVDWLSPVTRILPKGFNGLMLPEVFIDSPNIGAYVYPKIREFEYPDIKAIVDGEFNDENAVPLDEAYKLLREAVKREFEVNMVDQPLASYQVNFVELSKTEEYKDFSILETIYPGDTVTVIHEEEGINIKADMVSYKYDPVTEMYKSIELGNYKQSFTNLQNQIQNIQNDVSGMEEGFLETAKNVASNLINSGFGGFVRVHPDRILIMDTDDEKTAKRVWQWNLNGFGYSTTGVNGQYGLAITMNGSIVADFINVGILNANLIQTGKLKASLVEVAFNEIGNTIKIASDSLTIYKGSSRLMQMNQNGMSFWNGATAVGKIGTAGKLNITNTAGNGTDYSGRALFIDSQNSEFIQIAQGTGTGILIQKQGSIDSYAALGWVHMSDFLVGGKLNVFGSKNAIHVTRDGMRSTPAYELAESYLGDIGTANTGKKKVVTISIETLFKDTVNTSEYEYQVFIQSYGKGHVWVSERNEDTFVVMSSKKNLEFAWEIKAKRRGYEKDRMELQKYDNDDIQRMYEAERSELINE